MLTEDKQAAQKPANPQQLSKPLPLELAETPSISEAWAVHLGSHLALLTVGGPGVTSDQAEVDSCLACSPYLPGQAGH